MKKLEMNNKMNKNAVTLAALHTHTHTYNLLEKINRINIKKAYELSIKKY